MLARLVRDEEGAQVVEYALIIAVISIALILALDMPTISGSFPTMIARVSACLSGTACE